jgi:hypothetical protein
MKTLKQLTANLNLFTFSDIPKEYTQKQILNGSTFDYSERVNNNFVLPSEILNKYEHDLFWECKKQYKNEAPAKVELYYIEHSRLLFLSPKGNLLRLINNKGKFYFSLDYSHYKDVQNVCWEQREKAKKESGLIEPNYIGVFTEKKINDWLNYCDAEHELNKQIVFNAQDKNSQIEKEIQTFIDSVKCNFSTYHDKTRVETQFFSVTFTHDKKSQYLSKEIRFNGKLEDVVKITNSIK